LNLRSLGNALTQVIPGKEIDSARFCKAKSRQFLDIITRKGWTSLTIVVDGVGVCELLQPGSDNGRREVALIANQVGNEASDMRSCHGRARDGPHGLPIVSPNMIPAQGRWTHSRAAGPRTRDINSRRKEIDDWTKV
jgi:hypothetical protein